MENQCPLGMTNDCCVISLEVDVRRVWENDIVAHSY